MAVLSAVNSRAILRSEAHTDAVLVRAATGLYCVASLATKLAMVTSNAPRAVTSVLPGTDSYHQVGFPVFSRTLLGPLCVTDCFIVLHVNFNRVCNFSI